jgi:hypothetical protein
VVSECLIDGLILHAYWHLGAAKDAVAMSRLLEGRALALEGQGEFGKALEDHKQAQEMALSAG